MHRSRALGAALLLSALVAFQGGCGSSGPDLYPVSGAVTFNGEPVPEGYITFTPDNPSLGPEAGEIKDGKFSFDAKGGPQTVMIEASRFTGPENVVMGLRPKEQYIPIHYNLESILKEEVTPDGDNEFTFELTDDPLPEDAAL